MKKRQKEIAIELKGVTKRYVLHHEKPTFSEKLVKGGRREVFTALNDIHLKIYKGDKVGIIGTNGAGKTTLLKIIAGIATANEGSVHTNGRIVSLIDLEAGFHPDLTGEENVFLNGLVIGMSKNEIKEKYKEIVNFADIGKFIDAPLYTYSAGMKLRLGFAVAVHADPDILILDEGFAAGDLNFQKKATKKIQEFFKKNKTILMVSHWLEYLLLHSERIIYLSDKGIKKDGGKEIIEYYRSKNA